MESILEGLLCTMKKEEMRAFEKDIAWTEEEASTGKHWRSLLHLGKRACWAQWLTEAPMNDFAMREDFDVVGYLGAEELKTFARMQFFENGEKAVLRLTRPHVAILSELSESMDYIARNGQHAQEAEDSQSMCTVEDADSQLPRHSRKRKFPKEGRTSQAK